MAWPPSIAWLIYAARRSARCQQPQRRTANALSDVVIQGTESELSLDDFLNPHQKLHTLKDIQEPWTLVYKQI